MSVDHPATMRQCLADMRRSMSSMQFPNRLCLADVRRSIVLDALLLGKGCEALRESAAVPRHGISDVVAAGLLEVGIESQGALSVSVINQFRTKSNKVHHAELTSPRKQTSSKALQLPAGSCKALGLFLFFWER